MLSREKISPEKSQPFVFGFSDALLAEVGGVPMGALHCDVEAICRAHDKIIPLAQRLGVQPPRARLAGFCYPHVTALGAEVIFPEDSEPNVRPVIHRPEDIDSLREPRDYLGTPVVAQRLRTARELKQRRPDANGEFIGHHYEGPVTTAVLLMGPDFFLLPYDDPERAHRLLSFCVSSALSYRRALAEHQGWTVEPGPAGIPDDFAGMFHPDLFREFVLPYWDRMFEGLAATVRSLHSELLRLEHLPFLAELGIECFDPGADQYLTPELLARHCPVRFQCPIHSWQVRELSVLELQEHYRRLVGFKPYLISFSMNNANEEEKVSALLEVAREYFEG